ncbi:hypothetical protein Pelo_8073 [Pelomyxa schiedti]|nr:hypothetical protein Pelo_8073 [Pelomyxa schiedti]
MLCVLLMLISLHMEGVIQCGSHVDGKAYNGQTRLPCSCILRVLPDPSMLALATHAALLCLLQQPTTPTRKGGG